jgi:MoxR-like ATPase
MSDADRKRIAVSWARHAAGHPTTLALVGPAGTGKTSALWDVAADKGIGVFQFDCAGATNTSDWFGSTVLDGQGTRFAYSSFIEAIRVDGDYGDEPRMVILDELNRSETTAALNALMSILTQYRVYIPEAGETIEVSRNVFFAATMNRGSAYSGTVSLDAALVERLMGWVRLDFLPEADEVTLAVKRTSISPEDAARLVKAARQVRDIAARGEVRKAVSTRMVLNACSFVVAGMTVGEAAMMTWADSYDDEGDSESERGIVTMAIKSVLGA